MRLINLKPNAESWCAFLPSKIYSLSFKVEHEIASHHVPTTHFVTALIFHLFLLEGREKDDELFFPQNFPYNQNATFIKPLNF